MRSRQTGVTVQISRMGPSEAAWLARAAEPLFDAPPTRGPLKAYLADRRNVFLLASVNKEPVGFLRGTSLGQLHTRHPQMFLYEVAVGREHRRRGVGRALVERLLKDCRSRQYDEVFVLTDPGNRAAVRLYRRTGAGTETSGDRMFVYRLRNRRRNTARGTRGT